MHDVVIGELENHLSRENGGGASRAFHAHLAQCAECRAEVAEMESASVLFRGLFKESDAAAVGPSLGFYNRVAGRIIDREQKQAWGLFSPGPVFFRRIAFASLLLLAGLGSYLVSRESSFTDLASGADAAAIMAQHDPNAAHSDASDRDRMLVTLATYDQAADDQAPHDQAADTH